MLNVAFIWFGQFSVNKSVRLSSLLSVSLQSLVLLLPTYHTMLQMCHQTQHAAPPGHGTCNHWLDSGHYWSTTALCGQPPKDAARLYYGHGCLSSIVAGTASGYAKTGGKAVSTASITFTYAFETVFAFAFALRAADLPLESPFQRHASQGCRRLSSSPPATLA
jgi:hypothetical protein